MTADTNEALDALVKRLESHMGKADMQAVLKDCRQAADMITAQAADLGKLRDPVAVHANMMVGKIAKPTEAHILHLYPKLAAKLAEAEAELAQVKADLAEAKTDDAMNCVAIAELTEALSYARRQALQEAADCCDQIAHGIRSVPTLNDEELMHGRNMCIAGTQDAKRLILARIEAEQ